jgi:predicted TPR repeat methyltransferase
VRLAAAWATRADLRADPRATAELERALALSADQTAGRLRLAEWALIGGQLDEAHHWAELAVKGEPNAATLGTRERIQAAARDGRSAHPQGPAHPF